MYKKNFLIANKKNFASVYVIKEAPTNLEGLEFNASVGAVDVALIYSYYKAVLEARVV